MFYVYVMSLLLSLRCVTVLASSHSVTTLILLSPSIWLEYE